VFAYAASKHQNGKCKPMVKSSYFTSTLKSPLCSLLSSFNVNSRYIALHIFSTSIHNVVHPYAQASPPLQHAQLVHRREPRRDQKPQSRYKLFNPAKPLRHKSPNRLHRIRRSALRPRLYAARLVRSPVQTPWRRPVPFGVRTIWRVVEYQCCCGLSM
jgi:hypothetical protein